MDVSEEYIVSIFLDRNKAKQETSVKQVVNRAEQANLLHAVSSLTYYSTLKMEAKYSSETYVDLQRITLHYIPGVRTLHQNAAVTNNKTLFNCQLLTWFRGCLIG
jgi:hypothetical protein